MGYATDKGPAIPVNVYTDEDAHPGGASDEPAQGQLEPLRRGPGESDGLTPGG